MVYHTILPQGEGVELPLVVLGEGEGVGVELLLLETRVVNHPFLEDKNTCGNYSAIELSNALKCVVCFIVPCRAVLYCAVPLCCVVLCRAVPCCTVPCRVVLCRAVLCVVCVNCLALRCVILVWLLFCTHFLRVKPTRWGRGWLLCWNTIQTERNCLCFTVSPRHGRVTVRICEEQVHSEFYSQNKETPNKQTNKIY